MIAETRPLVAVINLAGTPANWKPSLLDLTFDGNEGLLLESGIDEGTARVSLPPGIPISGFRLSFRQLRGSLRILAGAAEGSPRLLGEIDRPGTFELDLPDDLDEARPVLHFKFAPHSQARMERCDILCIENSDKQIDDALFEDLPPLIRACLGPDGAAWLRENKEALAAHLAGLPSHSRAGEWHLLQHDDFLIVLRERVSGLRLCLMADVRSTILCRCPQAASGIGNIWSAEIGAPVSGGESSLRVDPASPGEWNLVWSLEFPERFVANVRIDSDRLVRLKAGWKSSCRLARVTFPQIGFVAAAEKSELYLSRGSGLIVPDATSEAVDFRYTYPSPLMMQFGSFGDGREGIYWQIEDPNGRIKEIVNRTTPAGAQLGFTHFLREEPGPEETDVPYAVALRPFAGNWFDAAALYRRWSRRQKWVDGARTGRHAKKQPEKQALAEADGWLWLTRWLDRPERLEQYLEALGDRRMALLMHDWRKDIFDTNYPVYEPRDLVILRRLQMAMRRHGGWFIPYYNVRAWQRETESWKLHGAGRGEVIDTDGHPVVESFKGLPQSVMDPGSPLWRRTVCRFVEDGTAVLDADGAYLDQLGASFPQMNYAPDCGWKGDPEGWTRSQRRLGDEILQALRNQLARPLTLTESCTELFLSYRSASLLFYIKYLADFARWVPAYQAVYHPFDFSLGQPAWPSQPQYFLLAARDLCNGNQPFFNVAVDLADVPESFAFFLDLVDAWREHRRFLGGGEMAAPPSIRCSSVDVPWEWKGERGTAAGVASVQGSAWKTSGELLVLLVNHTAQARAAEVHWRRGPTEPVYQLLSRDGQSDRESLRLTESIPPRSVLARRFRLA